MARQRNYKAEYERRIARGIAAGFSRSQSRGHARVEKGEAPVSVAKKFVSMTKGETVSKQKGIKHRTYSVLLKDAGSLINRSMTLKGKASRVFFQLDFRDKNGEEQTKQSDTLSVRQSNTAIKRMLLEDLAYKMKQYALREAQNVVFTLVFAS